VAPKPPAKPVVKVLLVNAKDEEEARIALLEDGKLEELYVETAGERSVAGNVYRGNVQNVERGIGAAFVDLGRGLTGFLHVSDLPDRPEGPEGSNVTDLLETGQEVMVQITRDSIGKKGPALTARIALPGRFLVLMPNSPRSGVSRRIGTGRDRDRMKRLLQDLDVPDGMGLIVRTAGETADVESLRRDLQHLLAEWEALKEKAASAGIPGLLRGESDLAERCVRDIMPPDVSKIVVDDEETAARIRALLEAWIGPSPAPAPAAPPEAAAAGSVPAPAPTPAPDVVTLPAVEAPPARDGGPAAPVAPLVVLHDDAMPIFHAYGAESQIEDAYRRAIRLSSGGSIVIDPTEALVAIDVNSGRLTDEEDPESTALVTNLEAVEEATRQLRLRDLGGLVVIDFIDLKDRKAIRKVERALKDALARDRARIRVGRMGQFGCVILSRQRIRQALTRVTHEECTACGGTGRRRLVSGLGLRVLREMQARLARSKGRVGLEVRAPQPVVDWIKKHRSGALRDLRQASAGAIRVEPDARLAADGWAMKGLPPEGAAPGSAPPVAEEA
jgi:ribonuclease E